MKYQNPRQARSNRSTSSFLPVLAGTAILALPPHSQAAIILYQDDLNGLAADNLHATHPGGTLGAIHPWEAATTFKADGSVEAIAGAGGRGAFLPFTPTVGNIYTLSATLTDGNPDPNNNWLAVGFTRLIPSDLTASTRHADTSVDGMVWALHRVNDTHPTNPAINPANQSFFTGPRASNAIGNWEFQTTTVEVVITLNATDASNVLASLNINGGAAEVTGFNVGTLAALDINGVALSNDGGNIGSFADFSLTVIPEPSTSVIGILGACLLIRRRR